MASNLADAGARIGLIDLDEAALTQARQSLAGENPCSGRADVLMRIRSNVPSKR